MGVSSGRLEDGACSRGTSARPGPSIRISPRAEPTESPRSARPGLTTHTHGTCHQMKRTFAFVALLAALGVLCKLTLKDVPSAGGERGRSGVGSGATPLTVAPDPEAELLARYTEPRDRALVERT